MPQHGLSTMPNEVFEPITLTIQGEPVVFDGRLISKVSSEYFDTTPSAPNREWFEIEVFGVRPLKCEAGVVTEECELARRYFHDADNVPKFFVTVAFRQLVNGQLIEKRETIETLSFGEFALLFLPDVFVGEEQFKDQLQDQFNSLLISLGEAGVW